MAVSRAANCSVADAWTAFVLVSRSVEIFMRAWALSSPVWSIAWVKMLDAGAFRRNRLLDAGCVLSRVLPDQSLLLLGELHQYRLLRGNGLAELGFRTRSYSLPHCGGRLE